MSLFFCVVDRSKLTARVGYDLPRKCYVDFRFVLSAADLAVGKLLSSRILTSCHAQQPHQLPQDE